MMDNLSRREFFIAAAAATATTRAAGSLAQDLTAIALPAPQMSGGKPVLTALKERKSTREFSTEKLPLPVLSNLLWAAFGINRPDGRRTAPSAKNWQETDIYLASADGVHVYDAKTHALTPLGKDDIRALTGTQVYVKDAPLNMVYVADFAKTANASMEERDLWSACNTGFIAQNVYLFCTSEGLSVTVRGLIDKPALAKVLKLRQEQKIILAQSIGYPKK
jgi:SagB-type dehydrogenase family enzyme